MLVLVCEACAAPAVTSPTCTTLGGSNESIAGAIAMVDGAGEQDKQSGGNAAHNSVSTPGQPLICDICRARSSMLLQKSIPAVNQKVLSTGDSDQSS
jgi:hypothetical protein